MPSLFAAAAAKSSLVTTFLFMYSTNPPFPWSSSRTMTAWWQQIHTLNIFATLTIFAGRDIRLGVVHNAKIWRVYSIAVCFAISYEGVERGCEQLWVFFTIKADSNSMYAWQTGSLPAPTGAYTSGEINDVILRCFERKDLVNVVIR